MNFSTLLEKVGDAPVFESAVLLSEPDRTDGSHEDSDRGRSNMGGVGDSASVQRQLSRWVSSGRLFQLRRGLYALAPPYRKVVPSNFLIANRLDPRSYVSLEVALSYYDLIPEAVFVTTSVTSGRPGKYSTPMGRYSFQHLQSAMVNMPGAVRLIEVGPNQLARVATPEKALLDLLYFHPDADNTYYLQELRLQNTDLLDPLTLINMASRVGNNGPQTRRLMRAVNELARLHALGLLESDERR